MANQYFENNPNLKENIREINYYYKGLNIKFYSDNGVFSKGGIDFGSNLLIKNISFNNVTNHKKLNILDVGCGYGTIGLTLAKANPEHNFTLIDINLNALKLALKAKDINNINNANIFESNIYEKITEQYDIIVSNPPIRAGKKVVHEILLGAYDHLNDGGIIYAVIQKKQGAESAVNALKLRFSEVKVIEKDAGYWIITAKKEG